MKARSVHVVAGSSVAAETPVPETLSSTASTSARVMGALRSQLHEGNSR